MSLPSSAPSDVASIRVAIVDDSSVIRALFARWLSETVDIEVVGIHRNGLEAVRNLGVENPDVILLDLAMPELDGMEALPTLLKLAPGAKVLVVSSMSREGTDASLRCLMRGASHYLAKPTALDPARGADVFRDQLIECIRGLARGTLSSAA